MRVPNEGIHIVPACALLKVIIPQDLLDKNYVSSIDWRIEARSTVAATSSGVLCRLPCAA